MAERFNSLIVLFLRVWPATSWLTVNDFLALELVPILAPDKAPATVKFPPKYALPDAIFTEYDEVGPVLVGPFGAPDTNNVEATPLVAPVDIGAARYVK
jgi:hypothetical protein